MTNGRTLNVCTGSSSAKETLPWVSPNVRVPDLGGQMLDLQFRSRYLKRQLTETLSLRRLGFCDGII